MNMFGGLTARPSGPLLGSISESWAMGESPEECARVLDTRVDIVWDWYAVLDREVNSLSALTPLSHGDKDEVASDLNLFEAHRRQHASYAVVDYEDTYGVNNPTERAHVMAFLDEVAKIPPITPAQWADFISSLTLKPSE